MTHSSPFKKRANAGLMAVCLAVAFCAIGATWFEAKYSPPALAKIRQLPDFKLTERSGAKIQLSDLKGKVWLADLVYTTCPSTCPMLGNRLSGLQGEAFKSDAVRFVSISVNPTHDTPGVLRPYAERFHAEPGKWLFLTGDKTKVAALVNDGFLLTSKDAPDGSQEMVHSTKIALVDKNGVIRAYYEGAAGDESQQILRDIRRLLRE
jgi:protein SCO1/2